MESLQGLNLFRGGNAGPQHCKLNATIHQMGSDQVEVYPELREDDCLCSPFRPCLSLESLNLQGDLASERLFMAENFHKKQMLLCKKTPSTRGPKQHLSLVLKSVRVISDRRM